MIDGTKKPKIPSNFVKCTARDNEFRCNLCLIKAAFKLGTLAQCPSMVLSGHQYEHTFFQVPILEFRHGAGDQVQKGSKVGTASL